MKISTVNGHVKIKISEDSRWMKISHVSDLIGEFPDDINICSCFLTYLLFPVFI